MINKPIIKVNALISKKRWMIDHMGEYAINLEENLIQNKKCIQDKLNYLHSHATVELEKQSDYELREMLKGLNE